MNTKLRVSILDLYFGIICLFPIFTALVDGTIINKLLFGGLVLLHLLSMVIAPVKRKTALLLIIFGFHYIYAFGVTDFPLANSNLLFYFPFFLLYTYFILDNVERIKLWLIRNERFVHSTVLFWSAMVGISIFIPSCYYVKEGGSLYFGSWANSIWRLGPSAVFIQTLAINCMTLYGKKKAIVWQIIPMYCVFMGSSRSYLIVGLCLFAIAWYIYCDSSKRFWRTAIPMGIVFIIIVFSTSIGDKILYTLDPNNYGDFWHRVTSGRSDFWRTDLIAWSEVPIWKKLLGSGIDFTLDVSGLWAHNDFLELLCSFGIVGLVHYLYAMKCLLNKTLSYSRVPWIVSFMYIMLWLFNAFFNMHYTYFCAMLSYPILGLALKEYYVPTEKRMKNG